MNIVIIICAFIVILLTLLSFVDGEYFTINDFYDQYISTLSVPREFYEITAKVPETHYTAEVHDKFFIDVFDNERNSFPDNGTFKEVGPIDAYLKEKLLNRTDKYLVGILNMALGSDEVFIFRNIFSKINEAYNSIWKYGNCIIVSSDHIIYRDTKIYGTHFTFVTLHDIKTGKIYLISFKIIGSIFEDKIETVMPSNLISNSYQDYKKDEIEQRDPKVEKKMVCDHLKNIQKYRGIAVNMKECF